MDRIVSSAADGTLQCWQASTLRDVGLLERALEDAIAAEPALLALHDVGIWFHEVAVIRQPRLDAVVGRGTRHPDLLLLTNTGDVVLVEVKRLGNPELRGRDVIAQVVEYAAILSSLDDAGLLRVLDPSGEVGTLADLVAQRLPTARSPRALADQLRTRFANAQLHLVVACDAAPNGTADWVRAVGRQSALDFDLRVVEIAPFICPDRPGEVIWVPSVRARTEVIHRTTVVVTRQSDVAVQVDVRTDDADSVEEAVAASGSGRMRNADRARLVLAPLARDLGMDVRRLWDELAAIHEEAKQRPWSEVFAALAWERAERHAYVRGKRPLGFFEGRFGLNLLRSWMPGVFIGAYLLDYDHRVPVLAAEEGGDFALILDILQNDAGFDADGYLASPEFSALRRRLGASRTPWDFRDHLAEPRCVKWHPLHLRRPLRDVLGGTRTFEERRDRWFAAADDVTGLLLAGGELAQLRVRLERDEL
jgi:hypothetical protein